MAQLFVYLQAESNHWFNNRRLFEPIGDVPPAEKEELYYQQLNGSAIAA